MYFVLPILLVALFCIIILHFKWFRIKGLKKYLIISLFGLKVLAGLAILWLYTYYYNPSDSDIYKYYKGGKAIHAAADESITDYLRLVTGINSSDAELFKYKDNSNLWYKAHTYGLYNDNRTMIRFHALVLSFSQENIYVHVVIMAFLSFLGCVALLKAFLRLLPKLNKYLVVVACFLLPSCLLWTSGMLKEGLMMFALGFTFYFFTKLFFKFKIFDFLGFLIFAALLFLSKIYVLPALLPALLFMMISKKMKIRNQFICLISVFVLSTILVVFSKQIIGYDIIKTVSGKQNDFLNYLELEEDTGSTFELSRMEIGNVKSFFKTIPEGLLNSFFKPFATDINSPFILFSFLEVLMFILLAIISIIFFKKPDPDTMRFVFTSIIFVMFLFTIIGVYTPNIGALVRYRTPALPFLAALLFGITDWSKINVVKLRVPRADRSPES